ncbi:MAG: class I tRNA ligase family protein, partial [Geodermatophilaceae bacterium]|nr:class I tRNA ligase family protein [Geodermatophilaceae bacterium]
ACSAGPGTDTAVDPNQMKVGRRLANKVLNASRFVLGITVGDTDLGAVTEDLDRTLLAQLADVVDAATAAFEAHRYDRALEHVEKFFWRFCDDYVELVKSRAYSEGPGAASAQAALGTALEVFLRLFAPFTPFVTEEVWSWWQRGSVHRAPWPESAPLRKVAGDARPDLLDAASEVLAEVRKAKSSSQVSLRAEVARLTVAGDSTRLSAITATRADLLQAGVVADLVLTEAAEPSVEVELAPVD